LVINALALLLIGPGIALVARRQARKRRQVAFYRAYNEACRPYHIVL
jgi:hypothetical protein